MHVEPARTTELRLNSPSEAAPGGILESWINLSIVVGPVEGYLTGQLAADVDELDHVELIQEQWIGPELYETWDCHTVKEGRWWVVTPFANLYPRTTSRVPTTP